MLSMYPIAGAPLSGAPLGSNNVTGAASLSLTVSGTIQATSRSVTGTVSVGVTASGAISTPVVITGAASVGVTASGTLITPNQIAGNVGVSVTAGGVLKSDNLLSGTARIGVTASGVIVSPAAFTGTVGIGVTASGTMSAQIALSGSVSIPLTASGTLSVPVKIAGSVGISLAVSGTIVPYQAIADAIAGAVTAWVVNTATGGHSTYSNFTFNSFFRLGNDDYGCSDTAGFVRLSGTTDNGTPISWKAKTGITTFNNVHRKYVHDARVIMRADGDVALREIIDEETDISNALIPDDDRNGVHARRVKLPKGVRGTSWQFELSGTGTLADIKSLEVDPILSQRT